MGKRYYCDFCDKSFADNATNRKNHLKGVIHVRNRKLHYDSFRDAATILGEEATKKPCRKFFSQGFCEIGDTCRFSHMTSERRQELEKQVEEKRLVELIRKKEEEEKNEINPSTCIDEWLAKRNKKLKKEEKIEEPVKEEIVYVLPPHIAAIPNLPPSILPPPPDMLKKMTRIEEWG